MLRLKPVRHPLGEQFNPRLLPRTFPSWWRGRHNGAADSTNAIVDGGSVLLDVIVASQVERLAHALNVSLRKERADIYLKARRFRHCASQVLDFTDFAVCFVNAKLPLSRRQGIGRRPSLRFVLSSIRADFRHPPACGSRAPSAP
jgi:hypothetical protein